jgi:sterol desaturase/sphingolipid hydroxylase (fatty acid hydroxylase superfamily)
MHELYSLKFIELSAQFLPAALIVLSTFVFLVIERLRPGRELPHSNGWYKRAIVINLAQLAIIGISGITWNSYFRDHVIFNIGNWSNPIAEGFFYWIAGTFVFYWWHRLRHANGFWLAFHQIHHSPSRIELFTSFYKHPVEIVADSMIAGFLIYCVFGGSAVAGAWTAFFGATGEYFYHSNIRTPRWLGYFIQRPEHHSIHHELDVHRYNFGDITLWDRLFGTFKEADNFAEQCGFPARNEERLVEMLCFKDVYNGGPGSKRP